MEVLISSSMRVFISDVDPCDLRICVYLFYLVVMSRVQADSRWWSLGFVLFLFCSSFILIFLPVFFITNHTNFMETEKAKKILEELHLLILDWSGKQNIPMSNSIIPTHVIYHINSLFRAIQNGAQKASLRITSPHHGSSQK